MMTIPIFLLCKKVEIHSAWIQKALANLTVCGFGVYMIHYFFTGPSVALMRTLHVPICLQIPSRLGFCSFLGFGSVDPSSDRENREVLGGMSLGLE